MKKLTALPVSALMLVTPASGLVSAASAESGTIDTSSAPKVLPALRE